MTPDLPPAVEQLAPAEASLIDWAEEQCDAVEVEVRWLGLSEDAFRDADVLRWEGDPCRSRPTLRLHVVDRQGPRRLTVRPDLHIEVPVLVADTPAAPGDEVSWTEGTANVSALVGRPVQPGTWEATVPLAIGTPLTDSRVQEPVLARDGATVSIVLRRGPLTLTAAGRLLQSARLGDTVQVVNEATQVAHTGVLMTPTTVEIQ